VHRAAETNNLAKLKKGEALPLDLLQDIAQEDFTQRVQDQGLFLQPEDKNRRRAVVKDGEARTHKLVGVYAKECAPAMHPILVEERGRLPIKGVCSLEYVIDLCTADGSVHDLKTKAKSPTQADADGSVQLTAYSLAMAHRRAVAGEAPVFKDQLPHVQLDVVVCTDAGKTSYAALHSERTVGECAAFLRRITAQVRAIAAGVFPPCDPGNWMCSPRWCGYWTTCPYVSSRFNTRKA
jgi:hypothetical protein